MLGSIVRPETLSRQAYDIVRRAIRDGLISTGEIYSELQIARLLGISRTPVREAIIALAREGVVEKLPQRGVRLRTIGESEVKEVFRLRILIEGHVLTEIARSASSDDVRILTEIIDRQERASDPGIFLDIDEEFHLMMAELAGLERSRQLLVGLRSLVWLYGSAAYANVQWHQMVIAQHREILAAVADHDAAGARRAIRQHVVPIEPPTSRMAEQVAPVQNR